MLAPISFCNWIYFLSPTIRISLPTPRQRGKRGREQHRRVAWPEVITFMITLTFTPGLVRFYATIWESVEQRKWWVLKCGDSEQHGQFPRCIIRGFVLNETSQLRHVTRGNKRRECYKLGDGETWCLHFTLTDFCRLMRAFLQLINISTLNS